MARTRYRPTVGETRSLTSKIENLEGRLRHEDERKKQFCAEIECRILGSSYYDFDDKGHKFMPLPQPKLGDIVIVEYWMTWMGGSDPTGIKFAARVKAILDASRFTAVALSSYVPFAANNEFFAFDTKSTRNNIP